MKESKRGKVLSALLEGRHLSQLDCREFEIEDMRTPISHMRDRYEGTHVLRTRWFKTINGARLKEYWLEPIAV